MKKSIALAIIMMSGLFVANSVFAQKRAVNMDSSSKSNKKIKSKKELKYEKAERLRIMKESNKAIKEGKTVKPMMEYHGISESLENIASQPQKPISKENGKVQENESEELYEEPSDKLINNLMPSSPIQTQIFAPQALTLGLNFEGPGTGMAGFSMTGAPPDYTLAVGPSHVIAWVNSMYAVYNKSGALLAGPLAGNSLFSGMGNLCASTNRGDPILQYDRMADRWIMSQFAFNSNAAPPYYAAPYLQCIAVSTTNNPLGTYYRYSVTFTDFNDYGKLGVWTDAYYTSYNAFNNAGTNVGVQLCASDRTKMLAGDPSATTLCAPTAFYAAGGSFLPADFEGTTLPTNTTQGGIFMRLRTGAPRALRIMKLKPNFTAGTVTLTDGLGGASGSFVNLPIATTTLPCNDTGGTCVAQPGTANTLDTLGTRLMYRLAYRNIAGVDRLVVAHSADPDGAGARSSATKWYEIRNPFLATAAIYQESTFDPGATGDRWMGSMATNMCGDIGMTYTIANSATGLKPSIAVTGRLVTEPLNTMQAETITTTGTGSQTGTLTRWGDYSTMQVDPSDDVTFWYIGEYLSADGTFNWRTRIASAKFTSCAPLAANGLVRGRVMTPTGRGLSNASVVVTNTNTGEIYRTRTNSFGYFTFNDLPTGITYATQVNSKRYVFDSTTFTLNEDLVDLIITGH